MLNEAYERLVAAIRAAGWMGIQSELPLEDGLTAAGAYDAAGGDWYIVVHGDGEGTPTGYLVYRFLCNGWERGPFVEVATIPTPRAARLMAEA